MQIQAIFVHDMHLKKSILSTVAVAISLWLSGQTVSIVLEPRTPNVKDITIDPSLTGMTTYRIWLVLPDPKASVTAIFGNDEFPLEVKTSTQFWQCPYGDVMASSINMGLAELHPGLKYDSWVTIGIENNKQPGSMYFLESPDQPWVNAFEEGGSLLLNDHVGGSWFSMPGQVNTMSDNGKILLGQFTTDGKFEGKINCQVRMGDEEVMPELFHGLVFGN